MNSDLRKEDEVDSIWDILCCYRLFYSQVNNSIKVLNVKKNTFVKALTANKFVI